jgi:hypothetical protein
VSQRNRWVFAAAFLGAGAVGSACAAIAGIDTPKDRPEGDAGPKTTNDVWADDASPIRTDDGGSTDDGGPTMPIEAGPDAMSGCGGPPDGTMGVFVDGTNGHDTVDCGGSTTACATLGAALLRAQALLKPFLYVAAGTYFGPVSLVPGVTVQGGWSAQGGTWSGVCPPQTTSAVTIAGSAQSAAAVLAQDLGGVATLDTLTVFSKAATDLAPGDTAYGIIATGTTTQLVLKNVVVQSAQGAAGAPGDAGAMGDPAPTDAGVPDGGCVGNGATGMPGNAGPAADAGGFVKTGYVWSPGGTGETGASGHGGTPGGTGDCTSTTCYYGPGFKWPSPYCGGSGTAGCGGGGGGGGLPGGGGGSSIPIYVAGATVTGTGGLVQAGNGGSGGVGGAGGPGASGAPGAAGATGTCNTTCSCGPSFCCYPGSPEPLDGGAAGGSGGKGGKGGQGAGGPGGWSCAYVAIGDASVTLTGTRIVVGQGGAGGSPNGVAGTAAERCP